MANLFIISDTHFSHRNILTFKINEDSKKPLRSFNSIEEMDEKIVENWNKTIKPQDHVYHLGDVAMKRQHLGIIRRLNGHKRLVMGNHDIFTVEEYLAVGFEKVMGMRVLSGCIFTHVPIHPESLGRFRFNIHGHLHAKKVMYEKTYNKLQPDPRYKCVCVEQINYTPVPLENLICHTQLSSDTP